jgi:hypothetical protein
VELGGLALAVCLFPRFAVILVVVGFIEEKRKIPN